MKKVHGGAHIGVYVDEEADIVTIVHKSDERIAVSVWPHERESPRCLMVAPELSSSMMVSNNHAGPAVKIVV